MKLTYDVDSDKKFNKAVQRAYNKVGDLTIPYTLMTKSWFKANKSIFPITRKSPGKYEDYKKTKGGQYYKNLKKRLLGSPYPMLVGFNRIGKDKGVRSGILAESLTNPQSANAFTQIVNKKTLVLGTKVRKNGHSYPASLHFGTRFMDARPFMLVGGEQVATPQINQRRKNWIKTILNYVEQVSKGFGVKR